MNRKGIVYYNNIECGIILENDDGYIFRYDQNWLEDPLAKPISLTLPLQKEEFFSNTLFSFFDGLIPEGWLLNVVSHNWKINPNDRFGLMLSACRDCIGDVCIRDGVE